MILTRIFAAFFAATLIIGSLSAFAADENSKIPPPIDPAKMELMAKANPYIPKLDKKSREIGAKLTRQQLDHLYHLREGFGTLRAVSMVRRDVGNAVKACAKANPEIRDGIQKQFSDWTNAVDPIVTEKEHAIDVAVDAQTYAKPKDIRDYLKLIEQTADYANRNIDKEIVTTPEACNKLSTSMDKTQDVVSKLLAEMEILPWPPKEGEHADEPETPVKTPN